MRRSQVRILIGSLRSQVLGFFVPREKQSGATVVGYGCPITTEIGGLAERSNAAVLKTVLVKANRGSNP